MHDPDDDDGDNPPASRPLTPDESILERLDAGILAEVGAWWQNEDAEIAADAVETVAEETDCDCDDAINALSEEFGEREDRSEIEDILDERAVEDADESGEDEDEDEDSEEVDDDDSGGDDDDDE